MAIGILGVLSLTGATLIYYSTSNARSASATKGRETAYTLAEAGIAQALSVLNSSLNPLTGSLLSSTTLQLEGGSVTYSGTLSGETWTITSTGTVKSPAGASNITRTLTRSAQVYGLNSGANVAAWNRWYADSTTTCLTIQDVNITMPIATRGDLCLVGSATITGANTTVEVGDDVTMTAVGTSSLHNPSAATGWTSSSNVYSSNNVRATATLAGSAQSPNLDVTGFGVNLPTGSTVVGIEATIERMASGSNSIEDYDVYLLKAGAPSGSDKASTTDWTTSDSTRTYGGGTDLWGTTWTEAQVEALNQEFPMLLADGRIGEVLVEHSAGHPDLDQAAMEAVRRWRDQSNTPWERPWPLAAWPAVPTRFLLCRDDRVFPAAFLRRVVRERLGIAPDEIDGGHYVALSRPRELADRLEAYRAER